MEIREILKKHFGYDSFRLGQEELINHILIGQDVLGILPTGGGKSICYQIPALVMEGLTIVISPLIALMKDQVDDLKLRGIPARLMNSSLDLEEIRLVEKEIESGDIKLLYLAPERLESSYFLSWISNFSISQVAVDEAHCISQWGHDFRPSYHSIANFIKSLQSKPVVSAFTATATPLVQKDICKQLNQNKPYVHISSFNRENIYFSAEEPLDKKDRLLEILDKEKPQIIYASTRKNVDEVYEFLRQKSFPVTKYHAGLNTEERNQAQNDFIKDKKPIIVSTNAFGMGIDKPDVRQVIHYNMPKDLESYYQEAGRAGRDGQAANAILLFSRQDIVTNKYLISQSKSDYAHEKLEKIISYTQSTSCLRKTILNYFGEQAAERCEHCSACLEDNNFEERTIDAQKILSCIVRMEQNFGMDMVSLVLKGSKNKRILDWNFNKLSTYGLMRDMSQNEIKDIIAKLLADNFLRLGEQRQLRITPSGGKLIYGKDKFFMKKRSKKPSQAIKSSSEIYLTGLEQEIYETLRKLRNSLAEDENVPPYVILHNSQVQNLALFKPINLEEIKNIPGFGEGKTKKYGQTFIDTLKNFAEENQVDLLANRKEIIVENPKASTSKRKSRNFSKSAKESSDLFNQGLSIEEIAERRTFTISTIFEHIRAGFNNGYIKKVDFNLDPSLREEIFEAINDKGYKRLKPLKESLPDRITFDEIKMAILEYRSENKLNNCN